MNDECGNAASSQDRDSQERYAKLEELFWSALDLPANQRAEWLLRSNVDEALQKQVMAALQVDEDNRKRDDKRTHPAAFQRTIGYSQSSETSRQRLPELANYEIVEEIDRGGMGVVYRARQLRPSRQVAIKMMRRGNFSSPTDVDRFLNEANAASRLDDEGVVPVYEVGEYRGEPFIVMKFINGQTFQERLNRNDISTPEALQQLCHVARAIARAHQQGIIHRDLKPSNILIDRFGRPWVTDFGLAKCLDTDASLTAAGEIMGTPGYMAPEQAFGQTKTASPAADVYGLGAILYRLLVGCTPVDSQSGNLAQVIQRIREHDFVSPRDLDRSIPRQLNTVCMKSLETEPARRYANAGEFVQDLERCLEGEAIQAKPLDPPRKLLRWVRHRPGLSATWCALLLFYTYHLICLSLDLVIGFPHFNLAVSVITPAAALSAWFWQYWLNRTDGAAWTLYAWSTGEVLLLTALLFFTNGAKSGLVALYFALVALSVLRCRTQLVGYVTLLAMGGYTVSWIYTTTLAEGAIDPLLAIPTLLSLALIGLIQYFALRRSSVSFESHTGERLS